MKLTVLVPSEDYRSSAGARIRYGGLRQGLRSSGIILRLESIAKFDPEQTDCDALLISKCHDARAIVAAATLSRRGKLVGVDLFDDYFSQELDSRLVRYRQWLKDLLRECDFCLCSTAKMAEVVRSYKGGLPVHVVNDPARAHNPEEAPQLASAKSAQALRDQIIRATWFGVGDNPYFQVGLIDLFAYSGTLSELWRTGMRVELTVLTNRRAMQADGLELVSRLPVPCTVAEWSEDAEAEVLEKSLVAFLPVAAQSFSSAKSLNRALTAMTYGCQVLSLGHPLYAALEPLIYRDPDDLLSDLNRGTLRLSAAQAETYREKLNAVGSAETEALRLAMFLGGLVPSPQKDPARLCVVHGLSTRVEIHDLTKALGGLSVASPYCSANLSFDVSFRGLPPHMKMSLSGRISEDAFPKRRSRGDTKAEASSFVPGASWRPESSSDRLIAGPSSPVSYQLATYAASMRQIERQLREVFGPIRLIISETSRIPVFGSPET